MVKATCPADSLLEISNRVSLSYKVHFSPGGKKEKKDVSTIWKWILSPSKNVILKGHPIVYPLKQKEICDYNPRFFMSSGLMFHDIIMNMISNKALEYHQEGVDSLFTKVGGEIFVCTGSHFNNLLKEKHSWK